MVGVRGPFGTAWPVEAAEGADVVVLAGGIGLAPLRPAIDHVLAHRERYGNVVVLYGGRSPRSCSTPPSSSAGAGASTSRSGSTVDQAAAGWRGRVGVVTTLVLARATFDPTTPWR